MSSSFSIWRKLGARLSALSSGTRIALVFACTITILLGILYVLITEQSKQSLVESVKKTGQSSISLPKNTVELPSSIQAKSNVLVVEFRNTFGASLIWIFLVFIVVTTAIGLLLGKNLITKPVHHLRTAIRELKDSKSQFSIKPTGVPEFDATLDDFAQLASSLDKDELLRKDLISDISHELKTPLMNLLTQIEAMRDGLVTTSVKNYDQLIAQIYSMNRLVERLHAYTNVRSKTVHPQKERISIAASVRLVAQRFQPILKRERITLSLNMPENVHIETNRELFEQLLMNLFQNTLTHAHARHITISADARTFTFTDDGAGMPTSEASKVFERFYRGEVVKKQSKQSSGLGLSIVKDICDTFGWRTDIRTKPNEGFSVTIAFAKHKDLYHSPG